MCIIQYVVLLISSIFLYMYLVGLMSELVGILGDHLICLGSLKFWLHSYFRKLGKV